LKITDMCIILFTFGILDFAFTVKVSLNALCYFD